CWHRTPPTRRTVSYVFLCAPLPLCAKDVSRRQNVGSRNRRLASLLALSAHLCDSAPPRQRCFTTPKCRKQVPAPRFSTIRRASPPRLCPSASKMFHDAEMSEAGTSASLLYWPSLRTSATLRLRVKDVSRRRNVGSRYQRLASL